MPGQAFPIARMIVAQEDESVIVAGLEIDAAHLFGAGNDSLGEQEAHHEMIIVSRGPHQDCQGPTIHDHLQWFLDCEFIVRFLGSSFRPTLHLAGSGRGHD